MKFFHRLSILKIIVTVIVGIIVNHYTIAQSDSSTSDAPMMEYVNHEKESLMDHLTESNISKLEIKTNLDELFMDRRYQNYKKAIATFTFENEETWSDSLEVKVRGVYRASNCDNPSLKIKYSKKLLKRRGLKKRNECKLVYPCNNSPEYQNYIYKEYLIYKMYNELTNNSLRVHLVDLTLRNAAQNEEDVRGTGFLIEHREELIKRVDAFKNDMRCISSNSNKYSSEEYNLFVVFQYMIGNVDFIIENCKNTELVQLQDSTIIPIPYDFDYTGMVNPSYAKPFAKFKQQKVTDRYFIGQKKSLAEFQPIFELFEEKKNDFLELIKNFDYLSKKERRNMTFYLKSFYRDIHDQETIEKVFIRS